MRFSNRNVRDLRWARDASERAENSAATTFHPVSSSLTCSAMASASTEQSVTDTAATLISKRNSTSVVWNYFGFKKEDAAQLQVLCRACRAPVATSRGNTTNLFQHLKKYHKSMYDSCMTKIPSTSAPDRPNTSRQGSLTEMFESVTPYERNSKRHGEITRAITEFIAKDMMPLSTMTKPGFVALTYTLDKRYNIPSRTYFSQTAIPELYKKCKEKVAAEVKTVEFFASTTDMWSSRTAEPYQSLTVHFIDEDFNLRARCLQTTYFPDDHTGENIAAGLREGLASWDLHEENHVCITTDNASNMVLAARLNEWTRLQCFGHRLHLAIENALKDDRVSRATALCRKLVGHFSHSWKKKAALMEAQRELKLPEHNLITECPTRWGSKEMMIARVLEQAKAISQVLSGDRYARSLIPTWQDIDVLESIHKALHPLLEFTDALSGEEYVSISYLKPVLHLFATSVLAEDAEDTDLTKSIKTKVLAYLNNKYGDPNIQELLDVACFLDPRFKIQYISTDNIPAIKTRLKTEMVDLAQRTYHREKRSRTETVQMPQSAQPLGEKAKRSLGSFFKTSAASPSLPVEDVAEAELNNYLMTPTIDGEDDPLAWWRVHKISYPQLCIMARKYLCVPATSAPSERLFSTGGNIVTCTRSSLKPAKVNILVFLAKNL
ncbi:E3 SUMO-protein ligase ZBED1-like [Carassius carassius]|uniref:E3 SUMO-protein ligase ZBED1-like n=1 Tax=Carassius carassius TaxID=217509 RepID=UPI0028688490|nr:E3 SUMO-protein ligase ZBED1-like [Carassius carassius]